MTAPKDNRPLKTAKERLEDRAAAHDKENQHSKWELEKRAIEARIEQVKAEKDITLPKVKYQLSRLELRLNKVTDWIGFRGKPKPGEGRPIGVPNRVTANFRDEYLRSGKKSPMEFLLDVMNEEPRPRRTGYEDGRKPEEIGEYERFVWNHKDRRIAAAIQVAPYIHPKLSSVEVGGHIGLSHEDALSELE